MDAPLSVDESTNIPLPSPPHPGLSIPQSHNVANPMPPGETTPTGPGLQPTTHRPPLAEALPIPVALKPDSTADPPSGTWNCLPCQRTFFDRERTTHLAGSLHRKRQAACDVADKGHRAPSVGIPVSGPGLWECTLCQRSMRPTSMQSHLRGSPHTKNKLLWDAKRTVGQIDFGVDDVRRAEEVRIEKQEQEKQREELRVLEKKRILEEHRRNWEAKREELRRAEQKRIAEEKRKEEEEAERERLVEAERDRLEMLSEKKRILEEHRRNWEAKREELRREEQKRIAEEKRKHEEKRREELRRTEQKQSEEKQKKWEEMEKNLRQAQEILVEQMRIEGEKREKDEKEREELRRIEKVRIIEEKRKKEQDEKLGKAQEEKMRIEEVKRMRVEQLRIEEQDDETNRAQEGKVCRENAAAADKQLRIAQENLREEWVAKMDVMAEAAAATRRIKEQIRIREAAAAAAAAAGKFESRRMQEVERAEEQDNVQYTAQQAQIDTENVRRLIEEQQEPEADRLALAQLDLGYTPGDQTGAGQNLVSLGYSTGLIDPASEAAILRYLQWQSIIQEMQQQQVWMQQPLVLTFPTAIASITDLPPILYRVYDETSVSKYSSEGFTAAASCMPQDAFSFRNIVNLHGNWSSREKTPFISVTSTADSAERQVAIRRASRNEHYIMVALIDTAALFGPCQSSVWKMHDARDHFGLQPWKCHRGAFDHEYICALRIPAKAVFACCRPEYFKQNALMFLESLGWTEGMYMEGLM